MPQPKGKTGNPAGRPKGTPNKITTDMKGLVLDVVNENAEGLRMALQRVENQSPERYAQLIIKLIALVVPKNIVAEVASDSGVTIVLERGKKEDAES